MQNNFNKNNNQNNEKAQEKFLQLSTGLSKSQIKLGISLLTECECK